VTTSLEVHGHYLYLGDQMGDWQNAQMWQSSWSSFPTDGPRQRQPKYHTTWSSVIARMIYNYRDGYKSVWQCLQVYGFQTGHTKCAQQSLCQLLRWTSNHFFLSPLDALEVPEVICMQANVRNESNTPCRITQKSIQLLRSLIPSFLHTLFPRPYSFKCKNAHKCI
jgi:hypothetical protein